MLVRVVSMNKVIVDSGFVVPRRMMITVVKSKAKIPQVTPANIKK